MFHHVENISSLPFPSIIICPGTHFFVNLFLIGKSQWIWYMKTFIRQKENVYFNKGVQRTRPWPTAIMTKHRKLVWWWKGPVKVLKAYNVGRGYPWSLLLELHIWEISGTVWPILQGNWRWYPGKIQAYPSLTGLFSHPASSILVSTPPQPFQLFTPPAFYAALNKISFAGQGTLLKAHSITNRQESAF